MVQDFISIVGEWITGFLSWLTTIFSGITTLFYVPTEGFTFIGTLLLFGLAVGLITMGLMFVMRLIRK